MISNSILQSIRDLFESLAPMLDRPAVQRQLLAFTLILIASSLLVPFVRRLFSHQSNKIDANSHQEIDETKPSLLGRFFRLLAEVTFPLVGITLNGVALNYFAEQGWLSGLLAQAQRLFLLLLVYRTLIGLFHLFLSRRRAQSYYARFLRPLFYITLIIGLNQVLSNVLDLASLPLIAVAENTVTFSDIFIAGITFYTFLALSWLLNDIFTAIIVPRTNMDHGISNMVLTFSHYLLFICGLLISLGMLGIDLSSLAIIGAGLSVGIGFGMQELVGNFISGIMLLFERAIRPGDLIKVGDNYGIVESLNIRSTTIRTHDDVDIIIPNQSLLTSSVVNYTHNNPLVRLFISVGVSYASDPLEVRDALMTVASQHKSVKSEPVPTIFFMGYGSSSLDFNLAVFVDEVDLIPDLRSEIYFMAWDELKRRGIEIPFPQRDIHRLV